ncbi:MAG: alpha/beta hydrolase [Actinobacteria bacterium]|nr:alpha/beta hydrolase [Actinomycetota bacterium]
MTGLVLILVAGLLVGAGWGLQRRLIYFPEPSSVPPVSGVLPGASEVRLRTSDGLELGAWLVPAAGSGRDVTVLVANGNAGDRSFRAPLAAALSRAGLAVLLFDYRGYGGNPGSPSEAGLALDVRAAHRYLTQDRGVPPGRLVYFGESLGAAVVTELATEHSPAGLVLRSPFVDLAAVGRAHYPFLPVGALLRDRYPVAEPLARIAVPTTVVYGTEDGIVPPDQSRAVAAAAGGPTVLVAVRGVDHNDRALLDGTVLIRAVIELADRAIAGRT